MGTANDLLVTFGPYDISGEMNAFDFRNPLQISEYRCANPVGSEGQLPTPFRDIVGEDFTLTGSGYMKASGVAAQALLLDNIIRDDALVGLSDTRAVGDTACFARCPRADYTRTAQVGDSLQYNFSAMSSGAIRWGMIGAYADVSASGNGVGFQFGAVGSDQVLTLALAAQRLSGTGTLVITWETAAAGTFVGATTRATFASFGAEAEEIVQVAGAITDTFGRPVYAVTGTGSWRVRIYLNIQ